jgi:hypothetical protein
VTFTDRVYCRVLTVDEFVVANIGIPDGLAGADVSADVQGYTTTDLAKDIEELHNLHALMQVTHVQ